MYHVFILLLSIGNVYNLTCKDVLDISDLKKIKLYELQSLSPQDVINCLSYLGKEKLTVSEASFIWNSIIEFYSGISNIPEDTLVTLHWVTIAISPEDYQNMTLGTLDVITNFGFNYGLSNEKLRAIADRVRCDFGDKQPEDYSCYDLAALRQILCAFNKSEIERIHPKAYKEVAVIIGKLKNCNYDVLQGFATLTVDIDAFGSPDTWTNSTIRSLGVVAEHLPEEITVKLKKKLGSHILENIGNVD
ncbi:unnamed protein product, partial [Brenthis ino]